MIINEARRFGTPRQTLASMLVNLGLDAASGTIPIAGDLCFKPHRRNAQIILDRFGVGRHH